MERPRDTAHGDFSSPVALHLAAVLKRPPEKVAEALLALLEFPDFVLNAQIAGPGFINIRLKKESKCRVVNEILECKENYGRLPPCHRTILLEFVSANPTGPLHIGHGRAAAYGDSLANILAFAGYRVLREYYVNDHGRQADILAASVWLRHALDDAEQMPKGGYRGQYLVKVAQAVNPDNFSAKHADSKILLTQLAEKIDEDQAADALVAAARDSFLDTQRFTEFSRSVCEWMLNEVIRRDLKLLNVQDFDCWFKESQLHESGDKVFLDNVLQILRRIPDSVREDDDGSLWFCTTLLGDDKDRVICRSDGRPTYFASDVAYHYDKLSRVAADGDGGRLINVLGADHHGYVGRLQSIMRAADAPPDTLQILLIQFVALVENGVRVKMSTRSGEFVPLADLVDMVGADIARYFYVSRRNDQHLDFDLSLAKDKSNANPVYYIQYAHARIHSLLDKWGGDTVGLVKIETAILSEDAAALSLCEELMDFPETIRRAADERAVHLIAAYLRRLAALTHGFYEKTAVLKSSEDKKHARLALMSAVGTVIAGGLSLLGMTAPKKM